jgi:hypothetical protein
MKTLTPEAHDRARAFVFENARPLEQARYAYHFEEGGAAAVLEALAGFQTPDGGFGHALEPDLRLPDASVLATTVGLQILRELDAPADHPLVRGAMDYLLQRYDPAAQVWPIIPPTVDAAPHAPWWSYDDNVAESWGNFRVNPRVEIVGYLLDYATDRVPAWLPQALTDAALTYLDEHPDAIGMFDLLCYKRLVATPALPGTLRDALVNRLTPLVDALVVKDPARWEAYVLTPLELVDAPDSPFYPLLADAVAANLDFEIAHQAEDGGWHPAWSWGDAHPEVWPQAEREWAGVLTVRTLRVLRNFGR